VFTNKKRVGIDTFVCAVSFDVAETPKAPIKDLLALSREVLLDNLSRNSCILTNKARGSTSDNAVYNSFICRM